MSTDGADVIQFPGAQERRARLISKENTMALTSIDITPDPDRVVETETGVRAGGLMVSAEDANNPAILEAHIKQHIHLARCYNDIVAKMAQES